MVLWPRAAPPHVAAAALTGRQDVILSVGVFQMIGLDAARQRYVPPSLMAWTSPALLISQALPVGLRRMMLVPVLPPWAVGV